jgi:hypothetical protein
VVVEIEKGISWQWAYWTFGLHANIGRVNCHSIYKYKEFDIVALGIEVSGALTSPIFRGRLKSLNERSLPF